MKLNVLLLVTSLLLMGCATGQKQEPGQVVCPRLPVMELDAPERDWQGQMQDFLRGTLPMSPDYKRNSTSAEKPAPKLQAN